MGIVENGHRRVWNRAVGAQALRTGFFWAGKPPAGVVALPGTEPAGQTRCDAPCVGLQRTVPKFQAVEIMHWQNPAGLRVGALSVDATQRSRNAGARRGSRMAPGGPGHDARRHGRRPEKRRYQANKTVFVRLAIRHRRSGIRARPSRLRHHCWKTRSASAGTPPHPLVCFVSIARPPVESPCQRQTKATDRSSWGIACSPKALAGEY